MRDLIFLKAQNRIVEPKEVKVLTWEIILLNVIVWTIMKREVISNGNDGPSQEILIFTKQIRHWILSDQVISGKRKLFFREDTPKEILDLYENIKSKLDFAYQEVHSNNGLKKYEK